LQSRKTGRVVLAVLLVVLGLWMAWDFLTPLGWAVVLALALWPAYRQFSNALFNGKPDVLAPLCFTIIVGVVLFVPVALAFHQATAEGQSLAASLAHVRENGIAVPPWLAQTPLGDHGVRWWTANLSDPARIGELIGGNGDKASDAAWTRALGGQFLHRLFMFFMALIALFVFLQNGAWIGNRVLDTADRLLGDPGERLASKMVDTVRGTVNGTVIVAVAEGIIIGAAYVLAGVPSPLIFTFLTIAFAMVPLGAWVVFSSAALLLVFEGGSGFAAAAVFVVGAVVMLVGDTLVWPALVGDRTRLPFLAALIGIFGGLQTFGLIGLFVGPMILAALYTMWREWLAPNPQREIEQEPED
jgi:predicted PurR-regulated permease PerM